MKKEIQLLTFTLLAALFLISCSASISELPASNNEIITPDSTTFLSATPTFVSEPTRTPTPDPQVISPNNAIHLNPIARFGNESLTSMDWSSDGSTIAVYAGDYLKIYDSSSYELLEHINMQELFSTPDCVYCSVTLDDLSYHPKTNQLATTVSTVTKTIQLWDMDSMEITKYLSADNCVITNITYSPDGTMLAGSGNYSMGYIIIWDTETGTIKNRLFDDKFTPTELSFNKDGSKLASYGNDGYIRIWDTETARLTHKYKTSDGSSILFSPTQDLVASGNIYNQILIWDLNKNIVNNLSSKISLSGYIGITSMAYSPTGDILAAGTFYGTLLLFDLITGDLLNERWLERDSIESIAFSPDGKFIATGTSNGNIWIWALEENPTIRMASTNLVFETPIFDNPVEYDNFILFAENHVGMNIISTDGKYEKKITDEENAYPISADGTLLQSYNPSSIQEYGSLLNIFTMKKMNFRQNGNISPNGDWIVKIQYDEHFERYLSIINTQTGQIIDLPLVLSQADENAHIYDTIDSVRWSSDGKHLFYIIASIFEEGGGRIPPWDVLPTNGLYTIDAACFAQPETCSENTDFLFSPYKLNYQNKWAVSADNQYIVVNNGYEFIIFNLYNNSIRKMKMLSEEEYYSWPRSIAISPDNQWIAYSSNENNLRLQSFTGYEGKEIATKLNRVSVLGWLTAPYLQPGDSFKVLPAGDHVYIRENPDLDAAEITFLISGNTFTVLDGPIQEDGYTWWYVESAVDGMKGWISEFYGWYEKVE